MQDGFVLDDKSRDLGVRHKISGGADTFQQLEHLLGVTGTAIQNLYGGLTHNQAKTPQRSQAGR